MILENFSSNFNKLYSISEASIKTDVEIYTLRYWEKKGLITPIRTATGRRKYSEQQITEILRLQKMMKDEKLNTAAAKNRLKNFKAKKITDLASSTTNQKEMKLFLRNLKVDIKNILRMIK